MFCPNCGANNTIEQKFCRSCGLNLEQTALSLLEQIPSAEGASLLKRERMLEKFGTVASGAFGLALLTAIGGIIYVVLTKMVLSGTNFWAGILFIFFIVSAAFLLAYVVLNESLKEKKKSLRTLGKDELQKGKTTGNFLEEGHFEPAAASVTENTTDLLYAENKTRKLE